MCKYFFLWFWKIHFLMAQLYKNPHFSIVSPETVFSSVKSGVLGCLWQSKNHWLDKVCLRENCFSECQQNQSTSWWDICQHIFFSLSYYFIPIFRIFLRWKETQREVGLCMGQKCMFGFECHISIFVAFMNSLNVFLQCSILEKMNCELYECVSLNMVL